MLTSATQSGPPRSSISSSKVFGGKSRHRISSFSSNSFFIPWHTSAAELASIVGLADDDIKLERAGALAEWWRLFWHPVDKQTFLTKFPKIMAEPHNYKNRTTSMHRKRKPCNSFFGMNCASRWRRCCFRIQVKLVKLSQVLLFYTVYRRDTT